MKEMLSISQSSDLLANKVKNYLNEVRVSIEQRAQ